MKSRPLISFIPALSTDLLVVLVFMLSATLLTAGLIPISELTSELIDNSQALKLVTEQQRDLKRIASSLEAVSDRLDNRSDLQASVAQLREASGKLDATLPVMTASRPASWFALIGDTSATKASIAGTHSQALRQLQVRLHSALAAVLQARPAPYQQDAAEGTVLSAAGEQLQRDTAGATHSTHVELAALDTELAAIASELQNSSGRAAEELHAMLISGLLLGALLVALVVLLLSARSAQDASLRAARQHTADILRTVKDGLFLLDRSLMIGGTYSAAMELLFQRKDIAGLAFESLLRNIVSEKTLATALKFVGVLWLERTNEKLVKSINPLGEVEIHLDGGDGKFDTRYLQFDFHRVRLDGRIMQVLVAVSDVTSRVELARELQASQSKAQSQVDTLLGILHIDPMQLSSFLSDSNAAMKMINSVLREPAREESAFRKKLDTLFRQAHAVKGEAAALGLSSIESRAHSFEDDLKALRERPDLSGNDFLPLVIKLDDLMTHLQSVNDVVARLSRLQAAAIDSTRIMTSVDHAKAAASAGRDATAAADGGLTTLLQQLAAHLADDQDKSATLETIGFEAIPAEYRRVVKDISIQGVRNAIVHGIEPAAVRVAAGKSPQGAVRLSFKSQGEAGYKLSIEDDGRGLAVERIKQAALEKRLVTPDQAQNLTPKQMYALLFQPGFSTLESATEDAGRGVGMNMVADLMHQIGGGIGIASGEGKFMRLVLTLPLRAKPAGRTVAA
jgi:two-component system, chemotaxis family, sensor kinase CheA